MLQLISRRFLRELGEAPGGNNLQSILKCPCIPFLGNQGLHNEIMLEGNRGRSRVMCEGSPYILVVTDTKEGHDELIEKVLKRLEENNLFVKPEKCKWKVREVEFLGVVIGPKEVEMQKEKMEGVLN